MSSAFSPPKPIDFTRANALISAIQYHAVAHKEEPDELTGNVTGDLMFHASRFINPVSELDFDCSFSIFSPCKSTSSAQRAPPPARCI
jgi:hypothetical protein